MSDPGPRRISRRALLRLLLLGGIGGGLAAAEWITRPAGLARYLTWAGRGAVTRLAARPAAVVLARCPSYHDDVLACLTEAWAQADMPDVRGKRVLVKPNLIDFIEGYPVTTAAPVVTAVVDLLAEAGASEIAVGDGPGFRRDALPVAQACGLAAALAERKVPFVDLNYDDPRPVTAADGWFFRTRTLWLPRHVREADLIVSVGSRPRPVPLPPRAGSTSRCRSARTATPSTGSTACCTGSGPRWTSSTRSTTTSARGR